MARGRLLSRSLGSSRKFWELHGRAGALGDFAQALYPLVVANGDDFGRMAGDAFSVKFDAFPTSPHPEVDFELALQALAAVQLIQRYRSECGRVCLQVVDWEQHQPNLHKRTSSRFPEFPGTSELLPEIPGDSGNIPESPASRAGGLSLVKFSSESSSVLLEQESSPSRRSARKSTGAHGGFDEFWARYPRRKGRHAAELAWAKMAKDDSVREEIMAGLERHLPEYERRIADGDLRYVPHPATWLNQRRWQDEPEELPLPLARGHTAAEITEANVQRMLRESEG